MWTCIRKCCICLLHVPFIPFAMANWTLVSENGPLARSAHAGALDRHVFFVFAGKGDETFLDDLWVYNNMLDSWTLVGLLTAPAARKAHVALTDPAGDLWIHGGEDDQTFFQDLWKLSANTWTLVSNSSTVPGRSGHIAVWDSRNRAIWIHGGFDGALRQDLWKFDTEASNWFSIDSSYQLSRAYHVAALDEVNQALWIHGGYDGGLRRDLWKFDMRANSWELISISGPSARARHVAIWDSMNDALWVHGGFDGMACEDLWRFETATSTWNLVEESGPSARYDHVMAWDKTRLLIFLHGGYNEDRGALQDFWKFEVPVLTSTRTSSSTMTKTSATFTSSSITSTTTGTSTSTTSTTSSSSTVVVFDSGIVAADDDLFALLLALAAIGVFTCFLSFLWYRRRQKNREAVVPEPPPLPPPFPPSDSPPQSPKSPQFRVNMQVLIPPPEPQPPRTASFPSHIPRSPLVPVPPMYMAQCCEAGVHPLMIDQVDVEVLKTQPKPIQFGVEEDTCRPKTPGRTERAPHLPHFEDTLSRNAKGLPTSLTYTCGSQGHCVGTTNIERTAPCKICSKCQKVVRNATDS